MNVLLVDDHAPTREAMSSLIAEEEDLRVVAQAGSGEAGVEMAEKLQPDVVVMDIVMPGISGIEATGMILERQPDIKILVLSNHSGRALLDAVLDSGALGYVRKDQAFEELIPALRAVGAGRRYVSDQAGA